MHRGLRGNTDSWKRLVSAVIAIDKRVINPCTSLLLRLRGGQDAHHSNEWRRFSQTTAYIWSYIIPVKLAKQACHASNHATELMNAAVWGMILPSTTESNLHWVVSPLAIARHRLAHSNGSTGGGASTQPGLGRSTRPRPWPPSVRRDHPPLLISNPQHPTRRSPPRASHTPSCSAICLSTTLN
jgi:hypothetical protein